MFRYSAKLRTREAEFFDPPQRHWRPRIYGEVHDHRIDACFPLAQAVAMKEHDMVCPRAVEALTLQQRRLTELIRKMDNGRWWSEDHACRIDEDEVCQQADRIGKALDVAERLADEMAAEDGTGTGSQLAPRVSQATPVAVHHSAESLPTPDDLGPFSPGPVDPHPDVIHEACGYEQRAWSLSGGSLKLA